MINKDIKDLITGMVISDAHIEKGKLSKNARLKFKQKNRGFVNHIYDQLNPTGVVKTPVREELQKLNSKVFSSYVFKTTVHTYFTELHKKWYRQQDGKNIKIIPADIMELLTARALAYFIAGDGSYCKTNGVVTLCTDSFTKTEVRLLIKTLATNFGIKSTLMACTRPNGYQYRIRIARKEVELLQKVTKDYMPTMMLYRIGL